MKRILMAAVFTAISGFAQAGDLSVSDAVVPLMPPGTMVHAAYLTITNDSDVTRSLIGVSAEGFGMAHVHKSMDQDGMAMMTALHQLDIKAGQSVELKPGGLHIMLMHPASPVKNGQTVPLVLQFSNGEALPVSATVQRLNGTS